MFGDKSTGKVEDAVKAIFEDGVNKVKEMLGEKVSLDFPILYMHIEGDVGQKLNSIKAFDENAVFNLIHQSHILLKTSLTGAQVKVLLGLKEEPSVVNFQPIGQKTTR